MSRPLIADYGPLAVTEPAIIDVLAGAEATNGSATFAVSSCDSICIESTPSPTSRRLRASTADAALSV